MPVHRLRHRTTGLPAVTTPVPPTNVRLKIGDRELPLECRYAGWNGETHVWVAVQPWMFRNFPASHLLIDVLPAHTTVEIELGNDPHPAVPY